MTHRPTHLAVAKFLKDALSIDALSVPTLESMAKATGLLGEDQRITHSKLFKKAKKSLCIRSVRNGFGDGGEWLWLLDKQPAPSLTVESDVEESSVPLPLRVPPTWVRGVAYLDHNRP